MKNNFETKINNVTGGLEKEERDFFDIDFKILESKLVGHPDDPVLAGQYDGELSKNVWVDSNGEKMKPMDLVEAFNDSGSWENLLKKYPKYNDAAFLVMNSDMKYQPIEFQGNLLTGLEQVVNAKISGDVVGVRVINEIPQDAIVQKDEKSKDEDHTLAA